MNTILTELQYGNPSIETLQLLNTPCLLDVLLPELTSARQYTFPDNDSSITKNELNDIASKIKILQSDEQVLARYHSYDSSMSMFNDVRFETEEETATYQQLMASILKDVIPLVFKLKHHYQRPRPFQLAHYYKLSLFPFFSNSADSPAYPSAHACVSYTVAGVLGNHYPAAIKYFNDTAADAAASRVYMGVNYQSSADFGKMIADKILSHPEFVKKHSL